jgi:DNA-binding CsgD family transcriptional regulator
MKVRGISVLTRKMIITRRFGTDAWARLYRDVARTHSCFRKLVTPDTLVPLPAYLAFHDELVRRFFHGDERAHHQMGREAARWSLTEGPARELVAARDLRRCVAAFPNLWGEYFAETGSRSAATVARDGVDFEVLGLPRWHPYLEQFVTAYMTELLEMICANPMTATAVRGGGTTSYRYRLHGAWTADGAAADGAAPEPAAGDAAARGLSPREMDVVRLVAHGKTNDEIGMILGISGKTAQHHLARAYRKLGVFSRVGAALWLAEHNLIPK